MNYYMEPGKTGHLAVSRSLQPVRELCLKFTWYRRALLLAAVYRWRCMHCRRDRPLQYPHTHP
jgi:hypothetical protein